MLHPRTAGHLDRIARARQEVHVTLPPPKSVDHSR
jgi:hypothetical protein